MEGKAPPPIPPLLFQYFTDDDEKEGGYGGAKPPIEIKINKIIVLTLFHLFVKYIFLFVVKYISKILGYTRWGYPIKIPLFMRWWVSHHQPLFFDMGGQREETPLRICIVNDISGFIVSRMTQKSYANFLSNIYEYGM